MRAGALPGGRCDRHRSRSPPAHHAHRRKRMSEGASPSTPLDVESGLTRIDSLQDRPAWMSDAASAAEPQPRDMAVKPMCAVCNDAHWIKEAVPFGHPHFGVLFPCPCLQTEWARRTAGELARLSN